MNRAALKHRPFNQTPLMVLGSWVRSHATGDLGRGSIVGCPWPLLEAAYRHLGVRIHAVECQASNRRSRSTLRWLRRWRELAEREMIDQRDRATAALRLAGPALHRGAMNGLTHAYRDRRDERFVCGTRAMAKLQMPPGSVVSCMWCLPRVARMVSWAKESKRGPNG